MQQNFVPLLGILRLINNSQQPVNPQKIIISADPALFEAFEFETPEIAAGHFFELKEPKLSISAEYLLQLKERVKAKLIIKAAAPESAVLHESSISLLAFNECDGYIRLPELISAFIQPNSTVIEKILTNAAVTLKNWGHSSAISGYQTKDPGVVCNIAGAIFAAIASCQINYCVPPASFEFASKSKSKTNTCDSDKEQACLKLSGDLNTSTLF
ncbi:MAG: hypothetical protein A2W80_09585 [Candidatus Riflebacteria bacterium GWC2_50_8]|nr:MAG: hypothetical protein A2W80_09585 [Candidatus Riflebacteria bacterium GWC2_50_8]